MSFLRPGGFAITDKAMELWNLPKKAKVLDIGCGKGDTIKYVKEKYKLDMSGLDMNLDFINEAKKSNPDSEIIYGDGEFLDGFSSYSFDGVMMECVLSLINLPDEALHEAYCVLKKGGKLFLSDLYIKDPDENLIKALEIEVARKGVAPHDGACSDDCAEEHKARTVDFRLNSRFLQQPLIRQLEEIGYKNVHWEDFTEELGSYVAEKIMAGGNDEDCFCIAMDEKNSYKTGYFLLVAEK